MFFKSDILVLIINDNLKLHIALHMCVCVHLCAHIEFVFLFPFSLDSLVIQPQWASCQVFGLWV